MNYKKVSASDLSFFQQTIGSQNVFTDETNIEKYSRDETDGVKFPPEVILKPITAQEISVVLKYCNENLIPVSPRAAGTGLSANSLAVHGGVLQCSRFL